jgi:hypothetical protein
MIAADPHHPGSPLSLPLRLFLWLWVIGAMIFYAYQFRELVRPVWSLIGR